MGRIYSEIKVNLYFDFNKINKNDLLQNKHENILNVKLKVLTYKSRVSACSFLFN